MLLCWHKSRLNVKHLNVTVLGLTIAIIDNYLKIFYRLTPLTGQRDKSLDHKEKGNIVYYVH